MSVIYGASVFQEKGNPSNYRCDILGEDSTVLAVGDPLTISSGQLVVGGTNNTIVGISARAYTAAQMGSTNTTVYPPYIPADDTIFLMGTNSDLTDNETDGGTYYMLTTATTGAVQVNVTAGTMGTTYKVVEIVKVDPKGTGGSGSGSGLREVLVRFVKTPYTNLGTNYAA